MGLITIRDYAEARGVSYEAARQQVARYRDNELKGHVLREGKTQLLDDEAQAYLDGRRSQNPAVVIMERTSESYEDLKARYIQLLEQTVDLASWKSKKSMELAAAEQQRVMLEASQRALEAAKDEAEERRIEALKARSEAAQSRQEAQELKERLEDALAAQKSAETRYEALKARGLLARIFRKGE